MVDALREAWRVLSAHGTLVDLRPLPSSACPVEVVTPERVVRVGEVDASGAAADDLAADRTIERVVRGGWFLPHRRADFEFEFCWDSVGEMASFAEGTRRIRLVSPSYADLEEIHHKWVAKTKGRARLRHRRPMTLAVYRKATHRPLERLASNLKVAFRQP